MEPVLKSFLYCDSIVPAPDGKLNLYGYLGWVAWGVIHIAFLAGMRNRLGTVMSWSATLLTDSRRERAITFGDPETARQPYR